MNRPETVSLPSPYFREEHEALRAQVRRFVEQEIKPHALAWEEHGFVPREALPPPDDEDEFYVADLVGMAAETPDGAPLGQVKSVHDFGAGDLLEIEPPHGASWWLPFTREAVPKVLLAERRLIAVKPDETE